jgi:hypothetical protein
MKSLCIAATAALAVSCLAFGQTVEQQLTKLENDFNDAFEKKDLLYWAGSWPMISLTPITAGV